MLKFFSRRNLLALFATTGIALAATPGLAQADTTASAFVQNFGNKLVAIVNSDEPLATKKQQLEPLLDQNVDIEAIGRFCLGRYWKVATPEEQKQYLSLFHTVLTNAITNKIGDYKGVSFVIGQSTVLDNKDTAVDAVINRPGQPAADMQWIVSTQSGSSKVVDVVGEGASLRVTQQRDYSAYIARNGGTVTALIHGLERNLSHQK